MNDSWFENLSKALATPRTSRRGFFNRLLCLALAGSVPAWLGGCGSAPTPSVVPEFVAVSRLLADHQEKNLGVPISPDSPSSSLTHFQLFREQDNPILNSAEMHSDGCIYVAYTPLKGPMWYDSYSANESFDYKDDTYSARPGRPPYGAKFSDLKRENVDSANWKTPSEAFRGGRGPAPRWFKICVPHGISPDVWADSVKKQIPNKTRGDLLLDTGAYCYWDCGACSVGAKVTRPPEWQPILPVDTTAPRQTNGQKKYFPDLPVQVQGPGGITNFYLTWSNVVGLAQSDPERLIDILKWRGLPGEPELDSGHPIPWVSAEVEGVVPNSFLSGEDYRGDHGIPPGHPGAFGDTFWDSDYWLGSPVPIEVSASHGPGSTDFPPLEFSVVNSLADDWIIYVRPEPEYRFMLASSPNAAANARCGDCRNKEKFGKGNYDLEHMGSDPEHIGSLENEIEQWLIPGGFRPDAGDRVYMVGRWVVDCGHEDWHAEIHPYELVVSSHTQMGKNPQALGNIEVVVLVVITSDWQGHPLCFDLWPPPRPSATARLHFSRVPFDRTPEYLNGGGIALNVNLIEQNLAPGDNPNHLHLQVILGPNAFPDLLGTGSRGGVYPNVTRRLAVQYHLWWE